MGVFGILSSNTEGESCEHHDKNNLRSLTFDSLLFDDEATIHDNMVTASFLLTIVTFVSVTCVVPPYGRHIRKGWGPVISNKWGWILMEIPSVVVFAMTYTYGNHYRELAPLLLAGMWLSHYCYRTFVFPNLIRTQGKYIPLCIVLPGAFFNTFNSYLNARWISHLGSYPNTWLIDPRFLLGSVIFTLGLTLNISSDKTLINLRQPGESTTTYKIPKGGGFEYVSNPNYLGEIMEWTGWAIASWSLPGLSFALYTSSNLVPRALVNHRWYKETFSNYPTGRKAIVPNIL